VIVEQGVVRSIRIGEFKVTYVQKSDIKVEILSIEPKLDSLSTTKLLNILRMFKKEDVIRDAAIHGYVFVLSRLISVIEHEIKQRVGNRLLACLDQLQRISLRITPDSRPDEIRDITSRCLRELRNIPLRYLTLFKNDISHAQRNVGMMVDFWRQRAMNILDDQVKDVVEWVEKTPQRADEIIEDFLMDIDKRGQIAYTYLEIADELEKFIKALKLMSREVSIKIRITPEILEKIYNGDFSDICKQVSEKIRSLLM
jgi:hypothetical protein